MVRYLYFFSFPASARNAALQASLEVGSNDCLISSLISFQEVFYLNHHKTTVHIDKTKKDFKCEICDYTSYAKRYIIAHKAKAHRERKHMCDQCGLKFIYPWDLRKHTVIIPL